MIGPSNFDRHSMMRQQSQRKSHISQCNATVHMNPGTSCKLRRQQKIKRRVPLPPRESNLTSLTEEEKEECSLEINKDSYLSSKSAIFTPKQSTLVCFPSEENLKSGFSGNNRIVPKFLFKNCIIPVFISCCYNEFSYVL